MSLDGYVAGPDQSVKDPLGKGGEQLHQWVVALAEWRAAHGMPGGETNESSGVVEEIAGQHRGHDHGAEHVRRAPGALDAKDPWKGWWGPNPPFHHPVFVLTHHARPPLACEGGTTFTFVTDGIQSALEQAREAAGGKDVSLAGGAKAAQQYLAAGLVDEMEISVVARRCWAAASGCSRAWAPTCTA